MQVLAHRHRCQRVLLVLKDQAGPRDAWPVGAVARHIEAFFGQHPAFTERAHALITVNQAPGLVSVSYQAVMFSLSTGTLDPFNVSPKAQCQLQ